MIDRNDAFSILKIAPTDNKREIKKAYARLVREYHPEEHPEEWKRIHSAYETALSYADKDASNRGEYSHPVKIFVEKTVTAKENQQVLTSGEHSHSRLNYEPIEIPKRKPDDESELLEMFDQLGELSEKQKEIKKQDKEILEAAVWKLEGMASCEDPAEWKKFFDSYSMEILYSSAFLYKWAEILVGMKLSEELISVFKNKIEEIEIVCRKTGITPGQTGLMPPIEMIKGRLKRVSPVKLIFKYLLWGIACILFLVGSCVFGVIEEMAKDEDTAEMVYDAADNLVEAIESRRMPVYLELLDETTDVGLQGTLFATQEMYETVQSDVFLEMELQKIENGLLLKEGLYLSAWENEIAPETDYREITEAEELGLVDGKDLEGTDFYAAKIWTEDKPDVCVVCFIPEKLGLDENCKMYYSYTDEYTEIVDWDDQNGLLRNADRYYGFCFYGYRVFPLVIPYDKGENGVTIVLTDGK